MDEKKGGGANLVLWRHSFSMCAGWGEFFTALPLQIAFCLYFHVRINKRKKRGAHSSQTQTRASQINNKVSVRAFSRLPLSALTSISNFIEITFSVCMRRDNFRRLICVSPGEVWKQSSPFLFSAHDAHMGLQMEPESFCTFAVKKKKKSFLLSKRE
jgi:hypothetical protein